MTNRWYEVGITELIYEDVRAYEKHQGTAGIFDEYVWGDMMTKSGKITPAGVHSDRGGIIKIELVGQPLFYAVNKSDANVVSFL